MRYWVWFCAAFWTALFIALFFGYEPSKLTIGVAFFQSIFYFLLTGADITN